MQQTQLQQTSNSALVTYTWVKDVAGSDFAAAESVASSTDNYVDITTPGWYKVTASALLNRETKSAVSGVCKATFAPKLPLVTYTTEAEAKIPQGDTRPNYTGEGEFTLEVLTGTVIPEGYESYAEELFSENLSYIWKVVVSDQDERTLGQGDIDSGLVKSELGKSTLTVNAVGDTPRTFICYVTNTLNGQTVTSDSTNSLAFLVL